MAMFANTVVSVDNGLGLSPPMGWRSWNCYGKHVNQSKMQSIMDKMAQKTRSVDGVPTSLLDLGYNNCGLDDNWQQCNAGAFNSFHDIDGYPIINTDLFPDMKGMTDHGHALGLRVGWYMNNCICQEHSWKGETNISKHMEQSAKAVADYGFDGVKLDGCGQFRNLTWWANLLNATGRQILIENCHWGGTVPGQTSGDGPCAGTTEVSDCPYNFFRTSSDIRANWGSMHKNLLSTRKFQGDVPLSRPGSWAYPDMMEVGRMASVTEDRSHFGAWVITSSPLILGYDLNKEDVTDKIWHIISNKEAIAINQAWAGHPGRQLKTWSPTSPEPVAGNLVFVAPCNTSDVTQYSWTYNNKTKAIVGPQGLCLDAANTSSGEFNPLWLNKCDGSELQQFELGADGTIQSAVHKNRCLNIWAGKGLPGGPGLQLYKCQNVANAKFVFDANGTLSSQDKVCFVGRDSAPIEGGGTVELWVKPLSGGRMAVFVLNNGDDRAVTSVNLADLNITSASVRDVWAGMDLPQASGSLPIDLQKRDSALFVLAPKKGESTVAISV